MAKEKKLNVLHNKYFQNDQFSVFYFKLIILI